MFSCVLVWFDSGFGLAGLFVYFICLFSFFSFELLVFLHVAIAVAGTSCCSCV